MTDEQRNENIEDLDVTEEESEDVKGGGWTLNQMSKHSGLKVNSALADGSVKPGQFQAKG